MAEVYVRHATAIEAASFGGVLDLLSEELRLDVRALWGGTPLAAVVLKEVFLWPGVSQRTMSTEV